MLDHTRLIRGEATMPGLLRLQAQELVYRSALAVNARVLQPSLMDFLR